MDLKSPYPLAPPAAAANDGSVGLGSRLGSALEELDRRLGPRLDARRTRLAASDAPRIARDQLERTLASASWSDLVAALGPR